MARQSVLVLFFLASYDYTNDRNFYLEKLDYGNGDSVQYEYDQQGRVTKQTYEDASYVTYDYDNSGALATVYDSETGISTTYYYDLIDRMMKYVESGNGYSHSVGYEYDTINNLTQMVETINGVKRTTSYGYDDDNRVTSITNDLTPDVANDGITESYTYDAFGRITTKVTKNGDTTVLTETYTYKDGLNNTETSQIDTLTIAAGSSTTTYTYNYDVNGNITSVSDGTYTTTYAYDSANQLVREDNEQAGKSWTWSYDNAGNIQAESVFPYTVGELDSSDYDYEYNYDNSQWRDLLTAYDGTAITYDQIGNPLSDGTWSYTWEQGRQLATLSDGTATWTNTYNADGLRTSRANGTSSYSYVYNGSQLVQMTVDGNTLLFTYDASGTPQSVTYNGTTYFYATNLQGDITAILNASGETVVSYTYDAWGNHTSGNNGTGTDASTLGRYNPLRYRGYVYDVESELYYLQSRYYNPEMGRFINADVLIATGQGVLGNNMFAYCGNNPILFIDPYGTSYHHIDIMTDCNCEECRGETFSQKCVKFIVSCAIVYNAAKDFVTNTDENTTQQNLKTHGIAFYKGTPVFSSDLLPDGSAFSFGVIIMSDVYKKASSSSFSQTLNHEYGHAVHLKQTGIVAYAKTVAIPSLTGAALSNYVNWIDQNYYNLPWERIADQLGGVNRGYAPGANTAGSIYWIYTMLYSFFN